MDDGAGKLVDVVRHDIFVSSNLFGQFLLHFFQSVLILWILVLNLETVDSTVQVSDFFLKSYLNKVPRLVLLEFLFDR